MTDRRFDARDIDPDLLHHYVETWRRINAEIDTIHSLADILSLLQHSPDDELYIEPHSLAHVFQLIDQRALRICAILDDFISIGEAKAVIADSKDSPV